MNVLGTVGMKWAPVGEPSLKNWIYLRIYQASFTITIWGLSFYWTTTFDFTWIFTLFLPHKVCAENDGGIHSTVKLTKNFLEHFICYMNDFIIMIIRLMYPIRYFSTLYGTK